jgi:hypothetical protein
MPRAEELAPVVNNIWQRLIAMKVATTVDRVSTKMNPADEISRNKILDHNKLKQALMDVVARDNTRLGLVERHTLFST